ncbi:MAG: hypothetical protein Q8M09_08010 [Pseudomonadota bacterium]|nr:hypothetical protein [Pseudomonadota bacterium]MDP1904172.1 hypothetical protein [Pseudomonadota bacterium]
MNKSIRIVLTVSEASPELYAALIQVPERLRAERVRTLSTIGLVALNGGQMLIHKPAPGDDAVSADKKEDRAPETSGKALGAAKKLSGLG